MDIGPKTNVNCSKQQCIEVVNWLTIETGVKGGVVFFIRVAQGMAMTRLRIFVRLVLFNDGLSVFPFCTTHRNI